VTSRDPRGDAPSSIPCPPACRAWSRWAGSISCPRACCCSPTTAAWHGGSSCRPMAGSGAYRARVHAPSTRRGWPRLANGITIEGVRYGAIQAKLDRQQRSNAWLEIALAEGKNREVRRVLAHLDLPVMRLIRIAFGPFIWANWRTAGRRDPGAGARQPAGRQAAAAQEGLGQASLQGAPAEEAAALMLKIRGRQASRQGADGARGRRHAGRPRVALARRCSTF